MRTPCICHCNVWSLNCAQSSYSHFSLSIVFGNLQFIFMYHISLIIGVSITIFGYLHSVYIFEIFIFWTNFNFFLKNPISPKNSIFFKMTIRPYSVNYVNKKSSNDLKRHFGMFGMFLDEFLATLEPPQKINFFLENFGLWFILVYWSLSVSQRDILYFQIVNLAIFLWPKFFSAKSVN